MDEALQRFGTDYRRFFDRAQQLHRWVPALLWPAAARRLGGRLSPYLTHREAVVGSMQRALGLDDAQAEAAWQRWLASHGFFGLTVYDYGRLDAAWLRRTVLVEDPAALRAVVEGGGLVLTYHTHHHNTLGCVLGLSGCHITGLAASAAGSPLHPFIGEVIDRINHGSARHFGGGDYLYTDEPRTLVRETRRLLAERKVIVSLGDFSQGAAVGDPPAGCFHGRRICPPSGAVEIALRTGAALHAAALYLDGDRLRLRLQALPGRRDTAQVLQQYFDFLAETVARHPWSWQGWDWYHGFPRAD